NHHDLRRDAHLGPAPAAPAHLLFHQDALPKLDPAERRPARLRLPQPRLPHANRAAAPGIHADTRGKSAMGPQGVRAASDGRYRAHDPDPRPGERRRLVAGVGPQVRGARETYRLHPAQLPPCSAAGAGRARRRTQLPRARTRRSAAVAASGWTLVVSAPNSRSILTPGWKSPPRR